MNRRAFFQWIGTVVAGATAYRLRPSIAPPLLWYDSEAFTLGTRGLDAPTPRVGDTVRVRMPMRFAPHGIEAQPDWVFTVTDDVTSR